MTDDRDILDREREWIKRWPLADESVVELLRDMATEIERDRARLAEWRAQYEAIDAENEELRDLTQAQNGYNAQMTDERDEARADNKRLRTELDAARDSAAQWEGLWRQDQETAATALRERDDAVAEVERLRGNQRVEVVEGWHGIAKGSD